MHDHRSSNVPVDSAAAVAAVFSFGQRLCGYGSALWARLGSSSRIDHHDLTASVCSFVGDHRGQLRPRSVTHMLCQHPASEALNVQIFNRDTAKAVDERLRLSLCRKSLRLAAMCA